MGLPLYVGLTLCFLSHRSPPAIYYLLFLCITPVLVLRPIFTVGSKWKRKRATCRWLAVHFLVVLRISKRTTNNENGCSFSIFENAFSKRAPPRRLAFICAFSQPTARPCTPSYVHFRGLSLPNKSSTLRFCLRLLFILVLIYFMRFCSFRARWTHAVGFCWLCSKRFPPVREARRTFKLSRMHSLLAAFGRRVVLLYLSFGVGRRRLTYTVSRCAFQLPFFRHSELPALYL